MSLIKFVSGSYELDKVQGNVDEAFTKKIDQRLLNYRIISGVSLEAATDKTINHGLEREPYWIVIKNSAEGYPMDKQSTNPTPKKTLVLYSTSARVVDLLVF